MAEQEGLFPCPCCEWLTLGEQPPGTFLVCNVCGWEDDDTQFDRSDLPLGANQVSLQKARENYAEHGISDPALRRHQRMVPGIRFSYQLVGSGWAIANIADGQRGCKMVPSYISDALGDLVSAINRVFETGQATCAWADEPGEWIWSFEREDDRVHIQIRRPRRWTGQTKDERSETWRRDANLLLFDATWDLGSFAKEMDRALKKILSERTIEQYHLDWRHPFPEGEASRLRHHLAALGTD